MSRLSDRIAAAVIVSARGTSSHGVWAPRPPAAAAAAVRFDAFILTLTDIATEHGFDIESEDDGVIKHVQLRDPSTAADGWDRAMHFWFAPE